VTSSVRNNSKCIVIAPNRTDQYKHSFFVQTAVDWNHLDENTVSAEKLESLKSALADHRDQVALHPSYHSPAGIIWRNITDDFQRNFIIFHTGRYLACFRHIFRELRYSFFYANNKCVHRNVLSKREVWMSIFHIINLKKKSWTQGSWIF
jgi:hypothetical protein